MTYEYQCDFLAKIFQKVLENRLFDLNFLFKNKKIACDAESFVNIRSL